MTGTATRSGGVLLDLALLAVVPLVPIALNADWTVAARVLGIDPWVYLGYFQRYPEYVGSHFPDTYYGSRLSWVLPGYLLHQVLPPVVASRVLHLGVFYTAVFSLYAVLRMVCGRRSALLAAALLEGYPFFLAAAAWDYPDGVGLAYYLLSFALLTQAARSANPDGWLAGAGVASAAMVHSNIFLVVLGPSLALYYPVARHELRRDLSWRLCAHHAAVAALGFVTLTVVLGAVNREVGGGRFLFFWPSVSFAAHWAGRGVAWTVPWERMGLSQLGHLVVPATVLLTAVGVLGYPRARGRLPSRLNLALLGNYVLCAAIFVAADLAGEAVLRYFFYTTYLIGPMALAVGAVLSGGIHALSATQFRALLTVVMVVSSGASVLAPGTAGAQMRTNVVGASVIGLLGIGLAVWSLARRPVWGFALGLALTSGALGLGAGSGPEIGRGMYRRVLAAIQTTWSISGSAKPRFWYDSTEPYAADYHALAAMGLWEYALVNTSFPAPGVASERRLEPWTLIVIPSARDGVGDMAESAMARAGVRLRHLGSHAVAGAAVPYTLTFAEVEPGYTRARSAEIRIDESRRAGVILPSSNQVGLALEAALPLKGWIPFDRDRVVEHRPDGVHVTTNHDPRGHSAVYEPALEAGSPGTYHFVLRFRSLRGRVVFGALSYDYKKWVAQSLSRGTRNADRERSFTLELDTGDRFWLVIANDAAGRDTQSQIVIEQVQVFHE